MNINIYSSITYGIKIKFRQINVAFAKRITMKINFDRLSKFN